MANNPSSRKRARQAHARRFRNASERSMLRTYIKAVIAAAASGQKESATAAFQTAVPIIDSMVTKGFVHRNKAARLKSRLNSRIKAIV